MLELKIPPREEIDVLFATPSPGLNLCAEGRNAAIAADRLLTLNGIKADYLTLGGDSYIAKARSRIATVFLEEYPNAKCLFFIDDDVGYDYRKPLEYILRTEDIVAGIYPKKDDGWLEFPVTLSGRTPNEPIMKDGFALASMVAGGFTCIKRHVIERIAQDCEKFYDVAMLTRKMRQYYEIFRMGILADDGNWYGEDVAFCLHCRQLGFEMWADTNHKMTHRGGKVWSGNLGDYIEALKNKKDAA
jgi:hypothetical protein